MWVSNVSNKEKARESLSPKLLNTEAQENYAPVRTELIKEEKGPLPVKKLFTESSQDVDTQVIRKQEKTFEQLLESQLGKEATPIGLRVVTAVVATAAVVDKDKSETHVTPVKNPSASKTKKAFLRRGSSAKYDP